MVNSVKSKKSPAKRGRPPKKSPAKRGRPPKKSPARRGRPPKKSPAKRGRPPKKSPARRDTKKSSPRGTMIKTSLRKRSYYNYYLNRMKTKDYYKNSNEKEKKKLESRLWDVMGYYARAKCNKLDNEEELSRCFEEGYRRFEKRIKEERNPFIETE